MISEPGQFQIIESYKTVRANLLFSLSTLPSRIVLVSSAEPNAGKSYTTSNLAITMAQTGSRVLLIDADMRKPKLHKLFQRDNSQGLSKLLGGFMDDNLSGIYMGVSPGLDLITSGPVPPNPSELLGHERAERILKACTEAYDYIFIDTPPVNVVSDALMLHHSIAGIMMVARSGQTTYDDFQRALEKFASVGAPFLGAVVVDVKKKRSNYNRYGRYRYYRYGQN